MTDTHINVLVRMTTEMKAKLQRESKLHERSLTAEITTRLRESLSAHGPTLQSILAREEAAKNQAASYPLGTAVAHTINNVNAAQEKSPAPALTDLDRAMLTVYRQLPVEKQLALLALFR